MRNSGKKDFWTIFFILCFFVFIGFSFIKDSAAAIDPDKGVFGGLWMTVSREPTTAFIDRNWNRIILPVYEDAFNGRSSTPGIYNNATMPKSFVRENGYDFSVLQPILESRPIRVFGGRIGLDVRFEGGTLPKQWIDKGYTYKPTKHNKIVVDLANGNAFMAVRNFLDALADEVNKYPQFGFVCFGELSGANNVTHKKVELVNRLAERLKYAYSCVISDSNTWRQVRHTPGTMMVGAGPKLAETGCGTSGRNWPIFDCDQRMRHAEFQWGNALGIDPPSPHPSNISAVSVEPNEFKITRRHGLVGDNNPWGLPLPYKGSEPLLHAPQFNINHRVLMWWYSGQPRNGNDSGLPGTKVMSGIAPANIITVSVGFGPKNWDDRIGDIQRAVKEFGFRGTGQLFPDFKDNDIPECVQWR